MPYTMVFQVDGGCRRNGYQDAIGAAACVLLRRNGQPYLIWTKKLPSDPTPTNQRAELTAVVLALKVALTRSEQLNIRAPLDVRIETDSKYALGCMTTWMPKWESNGFINAAGYEVANRDLLERAVDQEQEIYDLNGNVTYSWISRSENTEADRHCNELMDRMID
ncbi:hypothetical protein NX059_012313 [Plenodomus lindquistii]|nr:hypothetical protein NX059_012313 [Plenodomus lindquistii]